jgi:zinc/manganese transport system substrate-binding protein
MVGMRSFVAAPVAVVAAVALIGIAGCTASSSGSGRLAVVAGEDMWGSLAAQVGGDHVAVTNLITSPDADPHLFEPNTRDGYEVATASVVIVNGANYDPFMDRLLAATPSSHRVVVRVSDVLHVTGSDPNPHLWYDAPALPTVIHSIARAFTTADPADAAAYRTGAARTIAALAPLEHAVARLRTLDAGDRVAYTERVPGLLLAAAGLRVLTPPGFARSIENGADPSPADVASMRDLVSEHRINALLYNEQATSPVTASLESLARTTGIPVVAVTETLPRGMTFESWQLGQIEALTAALR